MTYNEVCLDRGQLVFAVVKAFVTVAYGLPQEPWRPHLEIVNRAIGNPPPLRELM